VRFEVPGRTENAHSTGLGLAISRSIADLHGGTIAAENRADRSGLCVRVRLPLSDEPLAR
jgi:signal transduction histidine kinase